MNDNRCPTIIPRHGVYSADEFRAAMDSAVKTVLLDRDFEPICGGIQMNDRATEALAEAWASIDGKLDAFNRERARSKVARLDREEEGYTGHFEGYIAEAEEMIVRLRARGFQIVPLADELKARSERE